MRKAVGVFLIILLLGSIVAAAGSTAYATSVDAQNDPYEKFWEILNRESELVVRLNATGNTTLVNELIQNSRLGAENAANISALIWQALEELKTSGVKTFYTAEELREMAQNISQNGLPQETVEALKAQGWTDEQIQALEEYIVKNADEINEDFNMTAFLEDFSMAFIDVAFKYNEYGAWALKTGYWKNIEEAPSTAGLSLQVNPILKRSWIETYASYYNYSGDSMDIETFYSNVRGLNKLINALILDRIKPKEKEYEYTKFMPPHPIPRPPRNITLNGSISKYLHPPSKETEVTKVEKRAPNGGLVFTIERTKIVKVYSDFLIKDIGRSGDADVKSTPEVWCPETWITINRTVYYWPSALEAYELSSNIMALLEAKKRGNNNPEIDKIINQKMAELKQSLGVYMIYSTSEIKRVSCYDNIKPGQPRPMNGADIEETVPVGNTSNDFQEPLNLPEWLIKEALDMENTPGVLSINGIHVVVDRNDASEIKYHVEISMVAKYNSVSKIRVNVSDKTSGGTDTGTISYLGPDEEETWRSGKFSARVSGSSIRITGNVKITYRPVCSSPPTSFKDGQTLSRECQDRTITRSYSETIDLGFSLDWSKVDVIVTASRHNIVEGESVTYTVKVKNGNSLPVDGVKYRVTVSLPQFDPKNYSGTVTIPANGEKTILTKTVAYPDSGTYLARATISWNGHTKSASDKVIVTTGTLVISDVDVSPRNPDDGDRVRFDVSIRNPSSRSRSLNVKLFIDGVKESSRTVSIGGNDESTTTLTWTATAGNHNWRVEVWEGGKLEDSRSGSIEVNSDESDPSAPCSNGEYWTAWLEVSPTKMVGEGKVHVKIMASYCNALPDVGGGKINLLYLEGSVYLDGKEIHTFDTNTNGNYLLVDETKVIEEFDWPVSVGNHNIKLKIKNTNGLLDYIKTKTDSVSVRVLPSEYSLELTEISCSNLNFNFEASNYYTQGSYVSPIECTLKFRNAGDTQVYVKELSADISVSPPDLEKTIPDHIAVSVNENVNPGEAIPVQIQSKATTTDRQMLLRVDGTMATLYIGYMIEGIINGANKIVGKGVTEITIGINVDTRTAWADYGYDTATIFISFVKITKATKIAKIMKTAGKLTGVLTFLDKFVNGIPNIPKNIVLEIISNT
ncbi:hypothetical protein APY94_08305 [Thermococcus celericrescens]|uniref:CARDB domain-containing protein n=1 Tax=Thermococcus celericrescens TaxID=227598 RepID=A0A117IT40_9EURY|nr:hypothetical protein [Thermococcus celericrescens]KUH32778.1 hypothetical protein APY94_08305 [Thermococcus celericrescens]